MYTMLLKGLVAAMTLAIATAEFLPKDTYMQVAAPKALAQIDDYRYQANLTLPQETVLDMAEKIIKGFETDHVDALMSMCEVAFGDKVECAKILGDGSGSGRQVRGLESRAPDCECSTAWDFCYLHGTNQYKCERVHQLGQCKYSSGGCGIALLNFCNGMCRY